MIKYNKNKKELTISLSKDDNIFQHNLKLSKINPNIVIFKHYDSWRVIDNEGKFHLLNKKITINL